LGLVWQIVARLARDGQIAHEALTKIIQQQLHEVSTTNTFELGHEKRENNRKLKDPSDFVLDIPADVIAIHTSVIEYAIFVKLKPSELMNSAWTNSALQHRSPRDPTYFEV